MSGDVGWGVLFSLFPRPYLDVAKIDLIKLIYDSTNWYACIRLRSVRGF